MPTRARHEAWLNSLPDEHRITLATLPYPRVRWGGLGCVPPPPGTEAPHSMRADAHLAKALTMTPPLADDRMAPLVKGIYNQGQEGSCASFTRCSTQSIAEVQEHGYWYPYDGHGLYHEVGGSGNSGSSLEANLNRSIAPGVPLLGDPTKRYSIDSWAYVPKDSVAGWINAVKAAIAAGHPVMIAVLLPTGFGYESSGAMTGGYHALCACAYDDVWLRGPNSWGSGWGRNGWYGLRWDYLTSDNWQSYGGVSYQYCYACVPLDHLGEDGGPNPPPPPPQGPKLASLDLAGSRVKAGERIAARVTLDSLAPAGGAQVAISSSDAIATPPATVPILAGTAEGSFGVSTGPTTVDRVAQITASCGGVSKSADLTVIGSWSPNPPPSGLHVNLTVSALSRTRGRVEIEITGGRASFRVTGNVSGRNLPNLSSGRVSIRDFNATAGEVVEIVVADSAGVIARAKGQVP